MIPLTCLVGGAIGAVIGALAWAGIGYATDYEIGWIAWGVGFLTGVGVAVKAKGGAPVPVGLAAAALALGGVVLGKYLVVDWRASAFESEMASETQGTEEIVISRIGYEIMEERGIALSDDEDEELPAAILTEARARHAALDPQERAARAAAVDQEMAAFRETLAAELRPAMLKGSFGAYDLLWLGLAAWTAYQLGFNAAGKPVAAAAAGEDARRQRDEARRARAPVAARDGTPAKPADADDLAALRPADDALPPPGGR
ncbi:MAG TPA: hypothetical protein VEL07_17280 [Planctomycetota bacterium]|nr:hypothetical protein [Planctomycetota bacterium]